MPQMQKSILEPPEDAGEHEGSPMKPEIIEALVAFGASEDQVLVFDGDNPECIDYLDLLPPNGRGEPMPQGVIRAVHAPALYFMDATNLASEPSRKTEQIKSATRILACRGERSLLLVVSPGQLSVYPVGPSEGAPDVVDVSADSKGVIRDIIEGSPPEAIARLFGHGGDDQFIHARLFSLINRVSQNLNELECLAGLHEAILALIGRALLTRFLLDRRILTEETAPESLRCVDVRECFGNGRNAAAINKWLDDTFNGDLLPLPVRVENYSDWFASLDPAVFSELSLILGHADQHGQLPLPGFINFAHVPVGLLSEVYEHYAHQNANPHVRRSARSESIHYTPRNIADFMVEQSLSALDSPHRAKVLDPACGAGVFVISAFRRLVAEHWKATGERPDTRAIRKIMYEQIVGFDVNGAALTLAALGLYLSAIEVDPEPLPASKLKFDRNLIGTVLHNVRGDDESWEASSAVMGSLGSKVGPEHNFNYDVVIGNPPWSSFPAELRDKLSQVIREVALKRDPERLGDIAQTHENPDQVPDLPFVWKSMEWAKKGGVIAFALHARFLFKSRPIGAKARNHLFRALNVTGILNAAELRQTGVWPGISAPFCLLFARNEVPNETNYFHYISPHIETSLNGLGRFRIDYSSAEPVQYAALEKRPYLLKILFRGTPLDVSVMDKIEANLEMKGALRLADYWDGLIGKGHHGKGYQVAGRTRDASFIIEMRARDFNKTIERSHGVGLHIRQEDLPVFTQRMLHTPRRKERYASPMALFNESLGNRHGIRCRVVLGTEPVAFTESYIGFSAHGHPMAENLIKYLLLLGNSDLFIYWMLMTSPKFGVERDSALKQDIESFPVIPLESMDTTDQQQAVEIADALIEENRLEPAIVNDFVYRIYGLGKHDQQVVHNTLETSLPSRTSIRRAEAKISDDEMRLFCDEVKRLLFPYEVECAPASISHLESWRFIRIAPRGCNAVMGHEKLPTDLADKMGSSRILIFPEEKCLYVGMLNQYRYWTPTRGRLLGLELLKNHADFLEAQ